MMLCISNIIPKANTERPIQRDTLKNITDKSKWNLKKMFNPQEGRKNITGNQKKGDK